MLMGFTYIPDNEGVVVLSTKRGEVLLILREGERLDQDLVELETVDHLKSVEVPNDDIRLNIALLVSLSDYRHCVLYLITLSNLRKIGRPCGKKVRPTVIASAGEDSFHHF